MDLLSPTAPSTATHELRFAPARPDGGPGYAFACDAAGRVGLDGLSERELANYLFARAMVGRQLCAPQVVPRSGHPSAGLGPGPAQPFLAR
jgi:hypothetical protein